MLPGGGGGDSALGSAIAHPASEADTPELWALGKRAVSPSGSTVVTEQAPAGVMQLPPLGVEGAPEPDEGRPAPVHAEAVVIAEENRGAEAAATPLEVSVFSVTFALSLARFMVIG